MQHDVENTSPAASSPAKGAMASPLKPQSRYDALVDVATLRADLR
jgi:hypothetical protein